VAAAAEASVAEVQAAVEAPVPAAVAAGPGAVRVPVTGQVPAEQAQEAEVRPAGR
jgi:hypothetical protein